jgi:hypothetical protein
MELSKFLLYYAILLQAVFCIYIFNTKMEWALMIGSFYLMILFTYGLTSELYKVADQSNLFVEAFKSSQLIKATIDSVQATTGVNISNYIIYLISVPAILNMATIKLVTNYEGNKEMRKSKMRTAQLANVKWLFLVSILLYTLIALIGFPIQMTPVLLKKATIIPLFAIPALYLLSIANLGMAIYVYKSY